MKHFLIRSGVFLALLLSVFYILDGFKISHKMLPNREVYKIIERSKTSRSQTKVLILGDSIARQLFESLDQPNSNEITSLACNQAIDIIGQFFLLRNFLERNHSVERVYLVYNFKSFKNNLDHIYTYNYFIKPFYTPEYKPLLTPGAMERIRKIPFYRFASFPPIHATFFTPKVEEERDPSTFLSQTSIEYLAAMATLLKERGIPLRIVCPPISQSETDKAAQYKSMHENAEQFPHYFDQYFEMMTFLPEAWYLDRAHFKDERIYEAQRFLIDHVGDEVLAAAILE